MSSKTHIEQDILEVVPHIRRFAYSLTRNQSDADDLTQSVIERVLEKGLPEEADLKKWMFRVCRNLWIDTLRATKTRENARPELQSQTNVSQSSEEVAGSNILFLKTRDAIERLPDTYRDVLTLVAIGGSSYKEAAEELAIPIGTVMSRLGRARAMIADKVGYHDQ